MDANITLSYNSELIQCFINSCGSSLSSQKASLDDIHRLAIEQLTLLKNTILDFLDDRPNESFKAKINRFHPEKRIKKENKIQIIKTFFLFRATIAQQLASLDKEELNFLRIKLHMSKISPHFARLTHFSTAFKQRENLPKEFSIHGLYEKAVKARKNHEELIKSVVLETWDSEFLIPMIAGISNVALREEVHAITVAALKTLKTIPQNRNDINNQRKRVLEFAHNQDIIEKLSKQYIREPTVHTSDKGFVGIWENMTEFKTINVKNMDPITGKLTYTLEDTPIHFFEEGKQRIEELEKKMYEKHKKSKS